MKKPSKPSTSSQAKRQRELKNIRARQDRLYKHRIARAEKHRKQRDAKLAKDLKRLQETGIYKPKGQRLTKYRRSKIKKAAEEYGDYLNPKSFFFVPVKDKRARKKLLQYAKDFAIKTTPIGMFIEHNGHTSAALRKSKSKPGEFEVVRRGKVKRGPNVGKKVEDIIPIEPLDNIVDESQRLHQIGASLGSVKKNERLAFRIIDQSGEGMSHHTYTNIDLLLAALLRYRTNRSTGAGLYMLRHVVIEKTTVIDWRNEAEKRGLGVYRTRKTRRFRNKGR